MNNTNSNGATITDIEQFELNNHFTLPQSYKDFLINYNGEKPTNRNFLHTRLSQS